LRRDRGHVAFASEVAPLLELGGTPDFDEIGVRQYRKLRTNFNGRTLYRGIEMFPAAHYFAAGKIVRYWQLPAGEQAPPSDEELRALVTESVRARRIADVPIGSYLSGGLDSTIVAALAAEPHTWTVGFPEHNEFQWGRMAAAAIGSTHHEVSLNPDEFVALAREMIRRRREPLSVPNEVLLYRMTREVRKLNTVVLSGEGADELFFGYDRIFRWAAGATRFDVGEFGRLYSYGSGDDVAVVEDAVAPFRHLPSPLAIVAAFFQTAHLHGLLRRLDHSTMLCSVEARVPFVDHHPLVERMAGVPFEFRLARGEVKAPLKRVFAREVPAPIRRREKVGFPVPLATIPFGQPAGLPAMDQWLAFNLDALGVSTGSLPSAGLSSSAPRAS
jgi:asparagine synthase (glutamine-hydrolysing)